MPKVVLLTMEYPPFFGGVGAYYYNLVKHMNADVSVIVNDQKSFSDGKVIHTSLLSSFGVLKWLKMVKIIYNLVQQDRNTIIWAGHLLPIGSACWLASKLFKCRYFVSLHGLDWQSANLNSRRAWLANKVLANALFITTNSHATANLLPPVLHTKVKVVYPAVNINNQSTEQNFINSHQLQAQKYFLQVGRLVKRKGQHQAIEAWKKITQLHSDFKLFIVGNGESQAELENLIIKHQLASHVKIINHTSNEEVAELYAHAYAFLFPVQPLNNDIEGFGIVCLEAQAYGLPVITTNCGGVKEAVGDSALLLQQATSEEIVLAVTNLISSPTLYQKLKDASAANVTLFSWQKSAKILSDTLSIYE